MERKTSDFRLQKIRGFFYGTIMVKCDYRGINEMTAFSNIFNYYIETKEAKPYAIARFCGIDRSNMYKLINGKRNPSSEALVRKIAEFLHLSVEEREELLEGYYESIEGYDAYHRRKSIEKFFVSFSQYHSLYQSKVKGDDVSFSDDNIKIETEIVKGKELQRLIHYVLHRELKNENGHIRLVMQPESSHILEILSMNASASENLLIEHIFCANNTDAISKNKEYYNLSCLQNIMPMFINSECRYVPMIYYDNINTRKSRFSLFSTMILTSEYAVLYNIDESYGQIIDKQSMLDELEKMFDDLKKDTMEVATKIDSLEEQIHMFEELEIASSVGISFQPEPCLIPFISPYLDKYMMRDMEQREEMQERIAVYIQKLTEHLRVNESRFIFSEKGVKRFVETGRITEIPSSSYYPIARKDQEALIQKLIMECKEGNYRMIKPEASIADSHVSMYVTRQKGYIIVPNSRGGRRKGKKLTLLFLHESGLLHAFCDYFYSMKDSLFYDKEETVYKLKQILTTKRS